MNGVGIEEREDLGSKEVGCVGWGGWLDVEHGERDESPTARAAGSGRTICQDTRPEVGAGENGR